VKRGDIWHKPNNLGNRSDHFFSRGRSAAASNSLRGNSSNRWHAPPKATKGWTGESLVTGGWHDDEAVGERHGGVVDLDGDAAAGARDPSLRVEVPAEVRHQLPRLPHRLRLQVRLRRRRPHRRLAAAPAACHGRPPSAAHVPGFELRVGLSLFSPSAVQCSAAEAARLVHARFLRAGPRVSESSAGNLGRGAGGFGRE